MLKEEMRNNSFSVYPNPALHNISIGFYSSGQNTFTIKLIDLAGSTVFLISAKTKQGENKIDYNISGIAKGLYLMSIEEEGFGVRTRKISVE
jgi:hypothetical protein